MKKRVVQVLFVTMILGLLAFSAMNFLATPAIAVPGTGQETEDVTGTWICACYCPYGWACIQSSEKTCWCAQTSNAGCCL
jgi:hypothetical protein